MNQLIYELRRKILAAESGGEAAITLALDMFEGLYREASAEGRVDDFFGEEAETAIDLVVNNLELLTTAFLRWLPNREVADLADKLCHAADVPYLQADALVPFNLSGSDKRRAEAVALGLASMAISPALSVGWLLSLAKEHGTANDTAELVEELMGYHVTELPASTKRVLMGERNPLVQLEVARRALERLNEGDAYLQNLPEAHELDMSVPMQLMYSSIRHERNRSINADSAKRSLFASLFKTKRFKYATRTSVEIHHGDRVHEKTLEMAPFSVSYELPVSERADPIAAHFQRQNFRRRGTA